MKKAALDLYAINANAGTYYWRSKSDRRANRVGKKILLELIEESKIAEQNEGGVII